MMMIVLLSFLILQILPSIKGNCHITANEMETELYRMKCIPELENDLAKTSTICIMTCKLNNLRFKHRCNLNGHWDLKPDLQSCGKVVTCPNPRQHWKQWSWKCSGMSQGSKCHGSCIENPNETTEIRCAKNGSWTPNPDLESCDFVTCPDPSTLWKPWIWTCPEGLNQGSKCSGSCSSNNEKKIEIFCGNDGAWTPDPDQEQCVFVSCQDPRLLWKHWAWTCNDGLNQRSTCTGSCKLNSDVREEISCGDDGAWTPTPDQEKCPKRGKLIVIGNV